PSGYYDVLTTDAVQRWQEAIGVLATGQIGLGQVVFVPQPIRVGALNTAPGRAAYPGQEPYQVTTTNRTILVPLNPSLPPAQVGERVSIVLPSLVRTPGRITAAGPAPAVHGTGGGHGHGPDATSVLTVTPDRPRQTGTGIGVSVEVSLTVESVRHV